MNVIGGNRRAASASVRGTGRTAYTKDVGPTGASRSSKKEESFPSTKFPTLMRTRLGRNAPCHCGSGKKFKKCCLNPPYNPIPALGPPDVSRPVTPSDLVFLNEMLKVVREDRFAPPQLLKAPFNGWIFRALGGSITWRKPTETFHEFCVEVVKITFGKEWLDDQFALAEGERHVVAKWLTEYAELTKRQTPQAHRPGQVVSAVPTGGAQELILLGRDLLYLTHLDKLPDPLLNRLRHMSEFQGAWYEVRVASALIHGGFDIEWLDKTSTSHCEFAASHSFTSEKFAVEAKSKRRSGLLNEPGETLSELRVLAHRNFRDALSKDTEGLPLLVFVDVNMPPNATVEDAAEQWGQHMASYIGPMGTSPSEPAKFAYAVCTNFSWHHNLSQEVATIAVVYDKLPMFSVNPTKHYELTRHAVEEGLKRVGALPPHTL